MRKLCTKRGFSKHLELTFRDNSLKKPQCLRVDSFKNVKVGSSVQSLSKCCKS